MERSVTAQACEAAATVLNHELAIQRTRRRARSRTFEAELDGPGLPADAAGACDQAVDVGLAAGVDDLIELHGSGSGDGTRNCFRRSQGEERIAVGRAAARDGRRERERSASFGGCRGERGLSE